jgi:hypothetical protein
MRPAWRSGHRRAPLALAYLPAQTSWSLLRRVGPGFWRPEYNSGCDDISRADLKPMPLWPMASPSDLVDAPM